MVQLLDAPVEDLLAPRDAAATRHRSVQLRVRRGLVPADVAQLRDLLGTPDRWVQLPKLAASHRSSVARVALSSCPVVVKRYDEPGLFLLRSFGRLSRAEREARAMELVASALPGNPVRVLAWAETRRWGFVSSSHLVSTELIGSLDLRAVKRLDPASRSQAVELVLRKLPSMVSALHDAGIYCGGALRGKNVLLQPVRAVFAVIDQLPARVPRRLRARHRLRDLATLSIELRRFLDEPQWQSFVEGYRNAALDLSREDAGQIRVERIEPIARRFAHRTPATAAIHGLERRLRHSRVGAWLYGRQRRGDGL